MRYDDYAIAPDPYSKLTDLNTQALDQSLDASQRAENEGQQNQEITKLLQSALQTVSVSTPQADTVKAVNTNVVEQIDKNVTLVDFTKKLPAVAQSESEDAVRRLNVMANHVESVVDYVSDMGANPPSTQSSWR